MRASVVVLAGIVVISSIFARSLFREPADASSPESKPEDGMSWFNDPIMLEDESVEFTANSIDNGEGEAHNFLRIDPEHWDQSLLLNPWRLEIHPDVKLEIARQMLVYVPAMKYLADAVRSSRKKIFESWRTSGNFTRAAKAAHFSGPVPGGFAFNGYLCPNGTPPELRYWLLDSKDPLGPKLVALKKAEHAEYSESLDALTVYLEHTVTNIRSAAFSGMRPSSSH